MAGVFLALANNRIVPELADNFGVFVEDAIRIPTEIRSVIAK
jgi:hypothetical protein